MDRIIYVLVIDLPSQLPRALEGNNPPRPQHHLIPRGRVPALTLSFSVHTELSEPADKYILAAGKGTLDDFNQGFGEIRRLILCESDLVPYGLDNVGLGQRHVVLQYVWECGRRENIISLSDGDQFVNDSK